MLFRSITDANNCTLDIQVTVGQPVVITAVATANDALCNEAANGQVDLVVSGGTEPYTFLWSNGATSEDLTDVPAGTYSVTVTDANNCTSTTTVTVYNICITLEKSGTVNMTVAGQTDIVNAGDQINYTFIITNSGTTILTNVTINDPLITVNGGPIASLEPGASDNTTFTGTYTITQADIESGSFTNIATVSGTFNGETYSDTDDDYQEFERRPSLSVEKAVDESEIASPATLNYTITVTNTGNVNLTNIALTDDLAGTATLVSGDDGDGILEVGESWVFTATYNATQSDIDSGNDLVNTVSVTTTEITDPVSDDAVTTISQDPDLTVEKTQTSTEPITTAGQIIEYEIIITNTGNVSITGAVATETFPGGGANYISPAAESISPDGILEVGEIWTHTATYTVTQLDIDRGLDLVNTISLVSNEVPGPVEDTAVTPVETNPQIEIDKTANEPTYTRTGDVITYSVTVTNTGNVTITNIAVTDPLTGLEEMIGSLAPGESVPFTTTYTITQADMDAGSFENTASAVGQFVNTTVDDTDTETVTAVQSLEIVLVKSGVWEDTNTNGIPNAGDRILYTFSITNNSNVTLTNVTVTDADSDVAVTGTPIASLTPGASDNTSFTGIYILTQEDIDAGSYTNTAVVTGTAPDGEETEGTADETLTFTAEPEITLEKTGVFTDNPPINTINAGDQITYTFTVTNTGNVTVTDITISDPLITVNGTAIPSLAPGASDAVSFSGVYTLTQADIDVATFTNTATATGNYNNEPVTATDDFTNELTPSPAISLDKEGTYFDANSDGRQNAGDQINYVFTVTNTGNVTLLQVTISDPDVTVSGGPINILEPGESDNTTFTAVYTLTQEDINAGAYTNTATATGRYRDEYYTGTDTHTLNIPSSQDIELIKEGTYVDANGDGIYNPGDQITYIFTVTNTGTVSLTNVMVTDLTQGVILTGSAIAELGPGAVDNSTFTAVYTLTQADIDAGLFMNEAMVTGYYNNIEVSDPDDDVQQLTRDPELTIVKALTEINGNPAISEYSSANDVISYSITVENTGNVTIDQVTVTDNNADATPVYDSGDANNDGIMEVGEVWIYSAYHTVDQADLTSGSVSNTAQVSGHDPVEEPVPATSNEVIVRMNRVASIELEKTGVYVDVNRDGIYNTGDQITYTFTVRNNGNVVLSYITITDSNPDVILTGTPLASLDPDDTDNSSYTGVYTLTRADIDAGEFTNTATVTAQTPSGERVENTDEYTETLIQTPSVELIKSGTYVDYNDDDIYNAGDRISYTFSVTNTGNVTLTNISIADPIAGVTISGGPISDLAPGDTDDNTFTGFYVLTQGDIDAGTFENTATVTAYPPSGNAVTDTDTDLQTFEARPEVRLEKTGTYVDRDPVGVYNPGDIITYVFSVENTGNVVLTRIDVADLDSDVVITGTPILNLLPGDVNSTSFTGTYTITQADINSGSYTNYAEAVALTASGETVRDTDDDTKDFTASPDIVLEKTGQYLDLDPVGTLNPGDRITYTFTVRNTGNVPLTNITVIDDIPGVIVSGSPISSLAPGAVNSTSITGYYVLTQNDINNGSFRNTAVVTAVTPSGSEVTDDDDDVRTFAASPAITIVKTGILADNAPAGLNAGDEIEYEFTVTNTGNVVLINVTVTDNVANVTITGSPITSLAPGESNSTAYSGRYAITQDDINAGSFSNTAIVTATTPSGGSVSDDDEFELEFTVSGDILLTKTGTYVDNAPAGLNAGDEITYAFEVRNTGNVVLSNVTLTDNVANVAITGSPIASLAPGVSNTTAWTGRYTITQADINAGSFTNRATVTATTPSGGTVDDEDDDEREFDVAGGITLLKTGTYVDAALPAGASAGDRITYIFSVTNTGNVPLTNVTITDNNASVTVTGSPIALLAPGETNSTSVTGSYILTQADVNAGSFRNTAIVTATTPSNETVGDDAEDTRMFTAVPELTITKSASPTTYNASGNTITYTITVRNISQVTISNITVTDPLTGFRQTGVSLVPGEERQFSTTYTTNQNDVNRGYVDNTASYNFTYRGVPYSDDADFRISANAAPAISIRKTVRETGYSNVNDILHYTITVTNTGNVTLSNIVVTDPLTGLSQTINSLAPGMPREIPATYRITQNDINNGSVDNTATARFSHNGTQYPPVTASVTVNANQRPAMRVVKSSLERNFASPGEIIHYTITVTNTGNVTLTGVSISDPNAAVTCSNSTFALAPGAQTTCTAEHVVTADDIRAGRIRNVATASGTGPGNNRVTQPSNEVIVTLNNMAPQISCPNPIITSTSASTCDILITERLSATYYDPNDNVVSLTWVMTGATTASSPTTGINNITSFTFNRGVTNVTYTVTDAMGLSASCSFNVSVVDNTLPTAICRNITAVLDINTGLATITVDDINNGSFDNCEIALMAISEDEFNCTDLGRNEVILTVIDIAGNLSTCTAVVTVVYSDLNIRVLPDEDVICNGETTGLILASNVPSTTWTWSVTAPDEITGAAGDDSGLNSVITQTLTNSDNEVHNVLYTIIPTVYGQCQIPAITAEVWVNPDPVIGVTPLEDVVCSDETVTLNVTDLNGQVNGQWVYDVRVEADPEISGYTPGMTYTEPVDLAETLANTGTERHRVVYTFIPRIVPGDGGPDCIGEAVTVTIWVHPRIRFTPEISSYNGFNVSCYGKSTGYINLELSPVFGPYSFRWTGPRGFTANTEDISGLPAGTYTVTITDVNHCSLTESFTLDQPEKLSMTITPSISQDGNYNIDCCNAQTGFVNLGAVNGVGAVDYLWADGYIGSNRPNMGAGIYKIILTDSNNCHADSTVTLTEPEPIRITFETVDPFCPDSRDGEVVPSVTGGVTLGDYIYRWEDNSTIREHTELDEGWYTLTVTDMNGCSATDSVRIVGMNALCLIIPDAFSPNRDQINDDWRIDGIELYPEVEITIYNRWGQLIWQSEKGYPIPWNGRSRNEDLPIDSYHYVIELHNGMKPLIGDVTIVR